MDIKAKRPPEMNKIALISVCNIIRIDLIKVEITQSVIQKFCMKFSESIQNWISTILRTAIFDLGLHKIIWLPDSEFCQATLAAIYRAITYREYVTTLYTRYPIVARALGLAAASKGILHTSNHPEFHPSPLSNPSPVSWKNPWVGNFSVSPVHKMVYLTIA